VAQERSSSPKYDITGLFACVAAMITINCSPGYDGGYPEIKWKQIQADFNSPSVPIIIVAWHYDKKECSPFAATVLGADWTNTLGEVVSLCSFV
jgi:hypothetical protein